jgi:hypothetical protein
MMRVCLFALFMGTLAMTATADEKTDEPKDDELKAPYTTKVTYRQIDKGRLIREAKDVHAFQKTTDGRVTWHLRKRGITGGLPQPGSEVVDDKGKVWVVTKANSLESRYVLDTRRK